ncbi:MAG: DUF4956 domain-containing protein [Lachnospiraceae bacterium]|nr:DUF4956 domain-containing protein [Lachnospiraceae bacterium]
MENIFKGLFDTQATDVIALSDFMICIISSLVIGFIIALMYMYKNEYSKSFIVTLATLPAIVCVIIMMVNGNVGAGVAVAGAFSLVRFRSLPGTAREIGVIFLAMGTGLITGMGYIAYGFVFEIVLGAVSMLYSQAGFGDKKQTGRKRTMRITIPEDLDYTEIFDDIFERYTEDNELVNVKTTNMGSLFRLTYNVTLKDSGMEKALIDDIRCRNGNLEIVASMQETAAPAEL